MIYVTVRQTPSITYLNPVGNVNWNSILMDFNYEEAEKNIKKYDRTGTITRCVNSVSVPYTIKWRYYEKRKQTLSDFCNKYNALILMPENQRYRSFEIPKHNGKMRHIDAPIELMKIAMRELEDIFKYNFKALYHTSAFGFIKNRNCYSAVRRHQQREGYYYFKSDFKDFFTNTTYEFMQYNLRTIYPFNEMYDYSNVTANLMNTVIRFCTLNNGLPQGNPISPFLTNLCCIPMDYKISKKLHALDPTFTYTRYADDIQISCKHQFYDADVKKIIMDAVHECKGKYELHEEKTNSHTIKGKNWMLGLMLNSDNNITIGHETKRRFKAACFQFAMDNKNNLTWNKERFYHFTGIANYYKGVEPEFVKSVYKHIDNKLNCNMQDLICNYKFKNNQK